MEVREALGAPANANLSIDTILQSIRRLASGAIAASCVSRPGSLASMICNISRSEHLSSNASASALLGRQAEMICTCAPLSQGILRPGGLAAWQVHRTLDYIERTLGSKLRLREIADYVAWSESHFSRAFNQSLGSSPMAYVGARRVERAKVMVASTRSKLTDIALAWGFSDRSRLTNPFRRVVGMGPGGWRRTSINSA
jgi:transcriptional regulator GlxA family with amidase domain